MSLRPLLCALAMLLPAAAAAQTIAVTAGSVSLRAGPDFNYPTVLVLSPGAQVIVQGCLTDYAWCDVSFGWDRGWVEAQGLYFDQRGVYGPLPPVAAQLGIPVVPFYFEQYWDSYYIGRPWYGERHRWLPDRHRAYPNQPPPPGTPVPGYRPPGLGQPAPTPRGSSTSPDAPRAPGLGRPSR